MENKKISERVIGCAMTVSNQLGAGFLEAVYANALAIELQAQGIHYEREKALSVEYKRQTVGDYYADFVVESKLIIELKALSRLSGEHEAQVMNYLRASGITVGLLLNFGTPRLEMKRIVLHHDDQESL